eukprot:jgi/Picsp_1/774/NSC_04263-R1_core-2 i-branching beta- -n-acetylglucosaminyltransferase family protein
MMLLKGAYYDVENEWFVLVSESDIPIYDPFTFYAHLTRMNQSMINACPSEASLSTRWNPRMSPSVPLSKWRKSNQWFAVRREHAAVILDDFATSVKNIGVYTQFKRYCKNECISDEHYIPTLFSVRGLEKEMYCESWGIAAMEWDPESNYAHPKTYMPRDINPIQFENLREKGGGEMRIYQRYSSALFQPASDCARKNKRAEPDHKLLAFPAPGVKSLTARKFDSSAAKRLKQVFKDCTNDLYLLGHNRCASSKKDKLH